MTKATATDAAQQLQRLEGVLQATGERAAAAEDGLRTTNQLVVSLQQQLAELKDRCDCLSLFQAGGGRKGVMQVYMHASAAGTCMHPPIVKTH